MISGMAWPPTLYKARGVSVKQPVCAICVDRTRGRTARLDLGFAVSVWLCAAHGSSAYVERNDGRDLVVTLRRIWEACACLTVPRERALAMHLARVGAVARSRARPGSYAWPALRREAERSFRRGVPAARVIRRLRKRHRGDFARVPSRGTMRRWYREVRWLAPPPRGSP